MTKKNKPSSPPNPPSPADVLAHRVGALVNGWTTRRVTREDWHAADDLIIEMYQYDDARATAAHIKLCEQYEAWIHRQNSPAPQPTEAPPVLQPALL